MSLLVHFFRDVKSANTHNGYKTPTLAVDFEDDKIIAIKGCPFFSWQERVSA